LPNFYNADTKFASDGTKRVTFDVNQIVTPTLSVRMDGMWQVANVAERNYTTDDRWGGLAAVKWTPTSDFTTWVNYIHTDLHGLPDFGVPYNTVAGAPVTSVGVPRQTYYWFVNRDFQVAQQDIGTITSEYRVSDALFFTNKFRDEHAILNYIGILRSRVHLQLDVIRAAAISAIRILLPGWSASIHRADFRLPTFWRINSSARSSSTPGLYSARWSPVLNCLARRSASTHTTG
jgi:hypothetical protein